MHELSHQISLHIPYPLYFLFMEYLKNWWISTAATACTTFPTRCPYTYCTHCTVHRMSRKLVDQHCYYGVHELYDQMYLHIPVLSGHGLSRTVSEQHCAGAILPTKCTYTYRTHCTVCSWNVSKAGRGALLLRRAGAFLPDVPTHTVPTVLSVHKMSRKLANKHCCYGVHELSYLPNIPTHTTSCTVARGSIPCVPTKDVFMATPSLLMYLKPEIQNTSFAKRYHYFIGPGTC